MSTTSTSGSWWEYFSACRRYKRSHLTSSPYLRQELAQRADSSSEEDTALKLQAKCLLSKLPVTVYTARNRPTMSKTVATPDQAPASSPIPDRRLFRIGEVTRLVATKTLSCATGNRNFPLSSPGKVPVDIAFIVVRTSNGFRVQAPTLRKRFYHRLHSQTFRRSGRHEWRSNLLAKRKRLRAY
jgi:hypothetical protein